MDIYKKESVRLAHAYLQEGCGKTRTKINDANPHTCMIWGQNTLKISAFTSITKQVVSVIVHPSFLKTSTFSYRTAKTLSICNARTKCKAIQIQCIILKNKKKITAKWRLHMKNDITQNSSFLRKYIVLVTFGHLITLKLRVFFADYP